MRTIWQTLTKCVFMLIMLSMCIYASFGPQMTNFQCLANRRQNNTNKELAMCAVPCLNKPCKYPCMCTHFVCHSAHCLFAVNLWRGSRGEREIGMAEAFFPENLERGKIWPLCLLSPTTDATFARNRPYCRNPLSCSPSPFELFMQRGDLAPGLPICWSFL